MEVKALDFHMTNYGLSPELGSLKITLRECVCPKSQEKNGEEILVWPSPLSVSGKYTHSMAKTFQTNLNN